MSQAVSIAVFALVILVTGTLRASAQGVTSSTPVRASALAGAPLAASTLSAAPTATALALGPRLLTPVGEFAVTNAAGGLVSITSGLSLHLGMNSGGASPQASWRGGILFDEAFRDAARLTSISDQEIARVISDLALVATMLQAAVVDAGIVPLVQGDYDLAWQATFAHTLALGLTLTIGTGVKEAVGRARPFERDCAADPQRDGCGDSDRFHSFYSGHTSMAFTSAGFSCAMHLSRSLYGDEGADIASCGASVALATTTGLARILSDRHYLTDVLVGAVLGFVVGYIVPLAVIPERRMVTETHAPDPDLDPGLDALPTTPGASWSLAPLLSPPGLADEGSPSQGPQATSSSGSVSGIGGTVGASVFGTF